MTKPKDAPAVTATSSPANFNDTTPAAPTNGANVHFQHDGSSNVSAYYTPASATALGGVKVGSNVAVAADGTISVSNADWNATSGSAQILNKPPISTTSGRMTIGDNPILDGTESGTLAGTGNYKINFYVQSGSSNLWVQWTDSSGTQHSLQLGS